MKKLLMIWSITCICNAAAAQQLTKDAQIKPAQDPVYNPNQLPNYYQNNSSYNNNSSQNNKPVNPNANSFPGNGNYADPSKSPVGGNQIGTNSPLPGAGPVNTTNNNTKTGSDNK